MCFLRKERRTGKTYLPMSGKEEGSSYQNIEAYVIHEIKDPCSTNTYLLTYNNIVTL